MTRGIPVLAYHGITDTRLSVEDWCFIAERQFRRQMEYLAENFIVCPLERAAQLINTDHSEKPLVAITFDDGFANYKTVAFPILKEHGFPSTVFVVTGNIATRQPLWYCRLHHAVTLSTRTLIHWGGETLALSDPEQKSRVSSRLQRQLKYFPPAELERRVDRLVSDLLPESRYDDCMSTEFELLTANDLRSLAGSPLVQIGAHTHTHAILSHLSFEEQTEEIRRSITMVSELTDKQCKTFAYPNGNREDFTPQTKEILAHYGITTAVTTIERAIGPESDPLELPRICIGGGLQLSAFANCLRKLANE